MVSSPLGAKPASNPRTGALCRLIFNYRLVALSIAVLWVAYRIDDFVGPVFALTVAAIASFLPIKYWNRFGPVLLAHPFLLAIDLVLGMAILTVMGAESPFFYYTLATALLSGVLYAHGGRGLLRVAASGLLGRAVASLASGARHLDLPDRRRSACALSAVGPGGAAVRRMLDRQAATEAALVEVAETRAIETERTRLARDARLTRKDDPRARPLGRRPSTVA